MPVPKTPCWLGCSHCAQMAPATNLVIAFRALVAALLCLKSLRRSSEALLLPRPKVQCKVKKVAACAPILLESSRLLDHRQEKTSFQGKTSISLGRPGAFGLSSPCRQQPWPNNSSSLQEPPNTVRRCSQDTHWFSYQQHMTAHSCSHTRSPCTAGTYDATMQSTSQHRKWEEFKDI